MVSNSIPFNLAAHKTVKRMKTEERIPRKAMEEKKKKKEGKHRTSNRCV